MKILSTPQRYQKGSSLRKCIPTLSCQRTTANPHSSLHNLTRSPLLTLPPELRSRIWSIALTGFTLHVGSVDREKHHACKKYRVHACTRDQGNVEEALEISKSAGSAGHTHYISRHHGCFSNATSGSKPIFALLSTCRQVYSEAALLPFSGNWFTFGNEDINRASKSRRPLAAELFLDYLKLRQAHAITRTIVHLPIDHYCQRNSVESISARISSLKYFICYVELDSDHWIKALGGSGHQWERSGKTVMRSVLRFGRYRRITHAVVPTYSVHTTHHYPNGREVARLRGTLVQTALAKSRSAKMRSFVETEFAETRKANVGKK